jgi:CheY-like chemotaxis protein
MPRILIVEDNDLDFYELQRLLTNIRKLSIREICRAKSKSDVIEFLKEGDFTCIILSCDMPEEGLDILKTVKIEYDSEIPVLFLTANGDELLATKAISLGAVNYFPKNKIGLITDLFIDCLQNSIEMKKIDISGKLKEIKIKSKLIRSKLDLSFGQCLPLELSK